MSGTGRVALLGTVGLALTAGCGLTGGSGDRLDLAAVCPNPLVVQVAERPRAEDGLWYRLLGADRRVDRARHQVNGSLVAEGRRTGITLRLRLGSATVRREDPASLLYTDRSLTLAQLTTDDQVHQARRFPTLAVLAPYEISPLAILWDRRAHPEFNTIVDIGQTDTKVRYNPSRRWMDYLVGSGLLRGGQVDGGAGGRGPSPEEFVRSNGQLVQEGYATSEPYLYEKELAGWRRPLEYQLLHDMGYPLYSHAVAIRSGDRERLDPCLRRLVPILQRSQVEFVRAPAVTNQAVTRLAGEYEPGRTYPPAQAEFAVRQALRLGLVSNGPNATLGEFDLGRVRRVIDALDPILRERDRPTTARTTPESLATNDYVDRAIGLPRTP